MRRGIGELLSSGTAWHVEARQGKAGPGTAGSAWLGALWLGKASRGWRGMVRQGGAGHGLAGMAWRRAVSQGAVGHGRLITRERTMDEFDKFWKHYPRKIAKGDARKAWTQTARIRPPVEFILRAIDRARDTDQWRRDGGQFVPYPATWLRGERWDDVYEVEVLPEGNWWDTASGIYAKARELGVAYTDDDPAPVVRARVKAALERAAPLRVVA